MANSQSTPGKIKMRPAEYPFGGDKGALPKWLKVGSVLVVKKIQRRSKLRDRLYINEVVTLEGTE